MGVSLTDIAQTLKDAKHKTKAKDARESDVTVQLIYAFNGTGKTRLSREFKSLMPPKSDEDTELEVSGVVGRKYLYYNAFTEDLFYWDNDLENDVEPKLKIHPNSFTKWIFEEQGQDGNIISNFQRYTDKKLTPHFNAEYFIKNKDGRNITVEAFTEITFSYERGNDERSNNIKISKGEESNFVWSVFYSLLEQVIDVLNVAEPSERETDQFDQLEYVFIDDPVSTLDDNHLIELAVNLAQLIKSSESKLKFIITTHNPLFYNVLHNEFKKGTFKKYFFKKNEDEEYELISQSNDSPFSYHLFLKTEIEKAIETGQLKKYHFNFLRNILERTSTFLGYDNWGELLPKDTNGNINPYETRIINISSHSKHSGDETVELTDDDKRILGYLMSKINEMYRFK
ncbi:AAA family ATPase [Bacillus mycoides]|uniref:AAA family ATPase n=1 Tax=Bacillus TaxID=1386 RepID=UPI000DC5302E|nr:MULTISPECIES: AAA family ATPase [Bacillus]MDI6534519.1 AAA family ATPase [Bacillus mycoides]RAN71757.1 anticodon nuclease [Bacillus sp. SRB_8]WJE59350.1 AAA family ATPase [Bacillus mycoides]WJE65283.1 AAA family ATPase [Bacillus mycoides]